MIERAIVAAVATILFLILGKLAAKERKNGSDQNSRRV